MLQDTRTQRLLSRGRWAVETRTLTLLPALPHNAPPDPPLPRHGLDNFDIGGVGDFDPANESTEALLFCLCICEGQKTSGLENGHSFASQ